MRKLHNQEFHNLNSSPNSSKIIQIEDNYMGGAHIKRAEMKRAHKILVVKPEGKKSLMR
jgi:hypothetical protein